MENLYSEAGHECACIVE